MRRSIGWAFVAAALGLAGPASGQVYRCVKNGAVTYSQTKPKAGECEALAAPAPQAPAAAGETPPDSTGDALKRYAGQIDKSRAEAAKTQAAAQEASAARQQRCTAAKKRQAVLDQFGSRIFRMDEKGERQYMSEADYQQQRQAIEQEIRDSCS